MTKLNKKSKEVILKEPPTSTKYVIEVNHDRSIEVSEAQAETLKDKGLVLKRKDRLVKNTRQSGYHELRVYRLTHYLYNKCTVYKGEDGFLIRLYKAFVAPIVEWHYRSCLAILMGRL